MCYNEVMKKIRFSRKTKRSKESKSNVILERTVKDEEGNKNTFRIILDPNAPFIKQEIKKIDD